MYPENNPTAPECTDRCGSLPACAPLAVPYVAFQQNGSGRYEQNEALQNGTLFPGLNLPFHLSAVAPELRETPMTQLQAVSFVSHELALYLDTHPSDAEAFELFRAYTALEKTARAALSAAGNPTRRSDAAENKTYTWLKDPWPWNVQTEGVK